MKIQSVKNCSFSAWYETLRPVTFRSEVIPLPREVIQYLLSDGIVLPKSADNGQYQPRHDSLMSSDSEDGVDWDEDEDDNAPSFPQFEEKVIKAIDKLGGQVFPKLNWSSPRDAAWVALNNSLRCETLGDILLLLKSSDFISRDLTQPFIYCDNCTEASDDFEYDLILRHWEDISPSGEFRCFVKENRLIGISQRAVSAHFPHMEMQKDEIVHDIEDFFQRYLQGKFLDEDFVFDVYRQQEGKVKLVDLNPYGGHCTDSLLFTWTELKHIASESDESSLPVFHLAENHGVQPSPFQGFGLPRDFVDLCCGEDTNKLIDVMKIHENIADISSDED